MELWEYQVIHLNVEGAAPPSAPPSASPPSAPPPAAPAPAPEPTTQPVFSREYLEKEFPGFYGGAPEPGGVRQGHPAHQLRDFLNGQGREGWLLLGFFPVGQLTMIVFRRPLQAAALESTPPSPSATLPPSPEPSLPDPQALLARIEALERRLQGPPCEIGAGPRVVATVPLSAGMVADADALASLRDGDVVADESLVQLELPCRSTSEAARALGFRSVGSLLNPAARRGYPRGLIKRGGNGRVAIYVRSGRPERGGREQHWWLVLPADP